MRSMLIAAVLASVGATNIDKHVQLRASPAPAPAVAGPAGPAAPAAVQNLDDPMPLKAAEQGFSGKDVQHKNKTTVTGDWRREYGPKGPQPLPLEVKAPPLKSGSVRAAIVPAGFITLSMLAVTV